SVKPGTDKCTRNDRLRLAYENKKSGLKGILGALGVLENAAGNSQNHGPVSADQGFESPFITPVDEGLQQSGLADVPAVGQQRGAAQLSHHPVDFAHRQLAPRALKVSILYCPKAANSFLFFELF